MSENKMDNNLNSNNVNEQNNVGVNSQQKIVQQEQVTVVLGIL